MNLRIAKKIEKSERYYACDEREFLWQRAFRRLRKTTTGKASAKEAKRWLEIVREEVGYGIA